MKGIVIEVKDNEAVILSDDGTVSKAKNNNYGIGQVIIMKENRKPISKILTSAAGFVAAIFLFAAGAFAYYTPTSYVSLDVNPSIEYSINMFDRVLNVKAVNDDGKDIVFNLDITNKRISKAVEETIDKLIDAGFITKDENAGVIISVSNSNDNKTNELLNEIKENTQNYLASKGETAQVEAEGVGYERVQEAKKLGITPGKLNLIEKMKNSSTSPDAIVIEEWLDKSVKEINKTIKENRKAAQNNKVDDDDDDDALVHDEDEDEDDDDDKDEVKKEKEKEKEKNKNKNATKSGEDEDDDDDEDKDDRDKDDDDKDDDDKDDDDKDKDEVKKEKNTNKNTTKPTDDGDKKNNNKGEASNNKDKDKDKPKNNK